MCSVWNAKPNYPFLLSNFFHKIIAHLCCQTATVETILIQTFNCSIKVVLNLLHRKDVISPCIRLPINFNIVVIDCNFIFTYSFSSCSKDQYRLTHTFTTKAHLKCGLSFVQTTSRLSSPHSMVLSLFSFIHWDFVRSFAFNEKMKWDLINMKPFFRRKSIPFFVIGGLTTARFDKFLTQIQVSFHQRWSAFLHINLSLPLNAQQTNRVSPKKVDNR